MVHLELQTTIYKWLEINWMIPNLYIGNGCFTKHPLKTGCLGFQADAMVIFSFQMLIFRGVSGRTHPPPKEFQGPSWPAIMTLGKVLFSNSVGGVHQKKNIEGKLPGSVRRVDHSIVGKFDSKAVVNLG